MRILFVIYFIILIANFGCINKISDIEETYSVSTTNDTGIDVEISYFTKGKLEFRLLAPEIEKSNNLQQKNLFPKGVQVVVYNSYFDTIATLSSDFAIQDEENKIVEKLVIK